MTGTGQPEEPLLAMAGILVTEQDVEKTSRQVLELACSALPGGDEGGITLVEPEGPRTVIATSDAALRVDSSQYNAPGGGPCLEAYRRQQVLRIDSTPADSRWPDFAATAAAHGLNSTLSVPLLVGGDGLGALNIYSRRNHGFTEADEQLAARLGSAASVALANARTYQHAREDPLQVRIIQLRPPLGAMGRHQQRTGTAADPQPDATQPALHLILLLTLTGIPRHDIHSAAREEELVRDPVHLLTTEIPPPNRHIPASQGITDGERRDLDAVRRLPALHERSRPQCGDQRGLADVSLTHYQQLRLILWLGIMKAAQVRGQLSRATRDQPRQRVS